MTDIKRRGRPATGRTSKTVRVPLDMDVDVALKLYYDWLPTLLAYEDIANTTSTSVRSEKLCKLFQELGPIPLSFPMAGT